MKVICKGYKTCEYKTACNHSKLHDIITHNLDCSENCTILNDKELYVIIPGSCFCDASYARKLKLEKLNESNM